jgi:hypothetical protein
VRNSRTEARLTPARPTLRGLAPTLLALALVAALAPDARAATFEVNNPIDLPDVRPSDGVCQADASPPCTLRAAVEEANALAGQDEIELPAGDFLLTSGLALDVQADLVVRGVGRSTVVRQAGVPGTPAPDRVFVVERGTKVTFSRFQISGGHALGDSGGNVLNEAGLVLSEVTVTGGTADASAGGIANAGGALEIRRSTISGNVANLQGGGVANLGPELGANLVVDTSTISGNQAAVGGGIYSNSTASITNSTVTRNVSADLGGGLVVADGRMTVGGSIVAENTSRDQLHPNCSFAGTLVSLGHNLEHATDCGFTAPGDIQGTPPLLGPLENNGGETDTHPLNEGSRAIDNGDPSGCPTPDQRGFSRPQGPRCDIGAYERDAAPETTITSSPPNPTNDSTPQFAFVSNEPVSDFVCRVDTQAFAICSSPHTTATLPDGTHTFEVQAIDLSETPDPTPAAYSFTVDTTAPPTPTVTDSDLDSPANDNQPEVKGMAESGATVRLYTTPTCTGTPIATGTAAAFATPGLTATVASNTTTNFRATATDAAGNTSACSAPLSYVEDSIAPPTPSVTDSDPDSPANDNQPEVKGTAAAGTTVQLYTNATCAGVPVATGTAAAFAIPGLTVTVPDNTTSSFRVTATDAAGNVSGCSAPLVYVEDSTLPGIPTLTDADPNSPSSDNRPEIKGSAQSGTTVRLYTNAACTGTPVATGTASMFASPGLTVTVADDTTTSFYATATNAAGNTSGCSRPLRYTEDSTAPDTTLASGPTGLTNDATPTFAFSSSDPGAIFRCRVDAAPFVGCRSPHTTASLRDGPHAFQVQAIDALGNPDGSPASRSFTIDTAPPETAITSGPSGSTTDPTPTFRFSSTEPRASFECRLDDAGFSACSSPLTLARLSVGRHTFDVRAIDAVGNVDPSPASAFDVSSAVAGFLVTLPRPVLGRTFNLEPVRGDVYVSVRGSAAAARARAAQLPAGYVPPVKGRRFVPLQEARQVPMGSFVDTRFGTVRLATARGRTRRVQAGRFSAGAFQVLQSRRRRARGLTELRLKGGNFKRCRTGRTGKRSSVQAARLSRRTIRRLRGRGRGRFRSRGRHSAATVRGTIWLTADRCDGTLTRVRRGKVAVRDFRRRRTVIVRAGRSYLARAQD